MTKKDNLKLILLALTGILLALACMFWSLGFWKQTAKQEETAKVKPSEEKELTIVTLSLDPSELTSYVSKEFTVNILAQSEKKLVGIDLYLSYDPQVLEIGKIKPGDFFTNAQELSRNINPASGEVFYALAGLTPKTGKGIIASFTFKGKLGDRESSIFIDKKTQVAIQEEEKVTLELPEAGKYTILE